MATIDSPQQLNMADRIALRPSLVNRCAAIVTNLALYILGEAGNAANHANRKNWADNAILHASAVADQVSWYVLNRPSYLNGGTAIDDTELQNAVESAIQTFLITPA